MAPLIDPTQSDTSAVALDFQNLHIDNIADFQECAGWDLCTVKQAILFNTDVNESTEVYYVANCPFELHSRDKIVDTEHIRPQDGQRCIRPRVPASPGRSLRA